jgi:hypothetical protein
MAFECEQCVVAIHPTTVVAHTHQRTATVFYRDFNLPGASVECVLDQLLDHGRWSLYDFSGGDLIGDVVWQDCDRRHDRNLPVFTLWRW